MYTLWKDHHSYVINIFTISNSYLLIYGDTIGSYPLSNFLIFDFRFDVLMFDFLAR